MLGLPRSKVFLVPWTSEWEKEFISEKERIQHQIGLYTVEIHHIGSTAVEHLSSKPIEIAINPISQRISMDQRKIEWLIFGK